MGRVITFLSESGAGIVEGDVWKGTWRDVWAGDFGARGREGGQAGWGGRECGLGRMHERWFTEKKKEIRKMQSREERGDTMVPWEGGLGECWKNHTAGRAGRPRRAPYKYGGPYFRDGRVARRERASPRWLAQGGVEESGEMELYYYRH